jgi:hypothetical protein
VERSVVAVSSADRGEQAAAEVLPDHADLTKTGVEQACPMNLEADDRTGRTGRTGRTDGGTRGWSDRELCWVAASTRL